MVLAGCEWKLGTRPSRRRVRWPCARFHVLLPGKRDSPGARAKSRRPRCARQANRAVWPWLSAGNRPAVVFVTAYERYALRAFDAHAIDYLLKPFDDPRLLDALARVRTWLDRHPPEPQQNMPEMLDAVASGRRRRRFVVKHGGRLRMVPAAEVEWLEARGNYVHLHHPDGPFLIRETLTSLVDTLDPERVLRVHRSAIVALPEVLEVARRPGGDQELCLRSGARVSLGRSYRSAFSADWRTS